MWGNGFRTNAEKMNEKKKDHIMIEIEMLSVAHKKHVMST